MRSSRQIFQGKHKHKHFPSYGLIFSPRHKASSDFWIFPSLFTSQWLSRIWRNLSRSTPLMLGCRQREKECWERKWHWISPARKAAHHVATGKSTQRRVTKRSHIISYAIGKQTEDGERVPWKSRKCMGPWVTVWKYTRTQSRPTVSDPYKRKLQKVV